MHLGRLAPIDGSESQRIVDKMPENYLFLGLLCVLFPRASFIHCRRDLRDVAVSCWMTDFSSIRWANDPSHIASRFQQYSQDHGPLAHCFAGRPSTKLTTKTPSTISKRWRGD